MHDTTLPLGRYAKDPRLTIVKVDGRDTIRTDKATIVQEGGGYEVRLIADPYALFPEHYTRSLSEALAFTLGEPAEVGPIGIQDWLHTDGRTYRHDPATTGMRLAETLRDGDVVDFPHIEAFEILGPSELTYDELGRAGMSYPARKVNGGFTVRFSYRSGDMVPVRFAR